MSGPCPRRHRSRQAASTNLSLPPTASSAAASNGMKRAGRLQRGRPRVADVEHVGALAAGGGREDLVQQVGPADDLEVDLDAGLLLELRQLRAEDVLVVLAGWCPGCWPSRSASWRPPRVRRMRRANRSAGRPPSVTRACVVSTRCLPFRWVPTGVPRRPQGLGLRCDGRALDRDGVVLVPAERGVCCRDQFLSRLK